MGSSKENCYWLISSIENLKKNLKSYYFKIACCRSYSANTNTISSTSHPVEGELATRLECLCISKWGE